MSLREFTELNQGDITRLPETAQLAEGWHQWRQSELDAITFALAARRPLLVRGEPGTGKTQLARAAAAHLGWQLESFTIHSQVEPRDLVYQFDTVKRLADAQAVSAGGRSLADNEHSYWEPGPIWRAYGWDTARNFGTCRIEHESAERNDPAGHVMLIDEIDKADSDLPNALLEIMGQRTYKIPALNLTIGGRRKLPLVIITTNEERELPPAFLRRCIVLNLNVDDNAYVDWLTARATAHFGENQNFGRSQIIEAEVIRLAAEQLHKDRGAIRNAGLPPPGLAEYLDLLYALHELCPNDKKEQLAWLERLQGYVYRKHPVGDGALISGRDVHRP